MSPRPYTKALISELAEDPGFAHLIELFLAHLPDRMSALERALGQHDLVRVRQLAHQLKGAAAGYGFPVISDAARNLEQQPADVRQLETITKKTARLLELCEKAISSAQAARHTP